MLTNLRVYSLQNDAITEDDNDEFRFVNMVINKWKEN